MDNKKETFERVIGLDSHPDSFTSAILEGATPAQAIIKKIFDHVPITNLKKWASQNTTPNDLVVLEASGNSFEIVRALESIDRHAIVLESCHLGKLKEVHASNDKISAVRIAKAFLAGTAKRVWVPDTLTQERRDWFHAYQKAAKRTTQMRNRIISYLSDNGVRIKKKGLPLATQKEAQEKIRQAKSWSLSQWQVLEIFLEDLRHAESQRRQWRSLIAQEVLRDPKLLQLVRLCGVRDMVAFAIGALVGDISRFKTPKSLVKYVGLNPCFQDSGKNTWSGGVGGHGRKDLRALLIQGAQSIMRSKNHQLANWGRKLLGRKNSLNLVAAAVARKLTVAIWYICMGKWTTLQEIDRSLQIKLGKIIGGVSDEALKKLDKTSMKYRKEICAMLLNEQTVYVLKPS